MSYEKQNFTDGNVLTAAQLNHMEDGIANAAVGGTYELIEDITLTEDVARFSRTADPNGVAYNFGAVRMLIEVPAYASASSSCQMITSMSSKKTSGMIYHQANNAVATTKKRVFIVARSDGGFVEYYAGVANSNNVTNMEKRPFPIDIWENISSISLTMNPSSTVIPAGTRIAIYAIRG